MPVSRLSDSGTANGSKKKYQSFLAGNSPQTPDAWDSISTTTLSGSQTTITFSIPQTYGHLRFHVLAKTTDTTVSTSDNLAMVFNSDIIDLLESGMVQSDLIYLDPPYGGSSSDYAVLYRFLEEYLYEEKLENLEHIQKGSKRFAKSKGYQDQFEYLLGLCGNFETWIQRLNTIMDQASKLPEDDTSSRFTFTKYFWKNFEEINAGKIVGWIFEHEDKGWRFKR
jgi:hypothetical protein